MVGGKEEHDRDKEVEDEEVNEEEEKLYFPLALNIPTYLCRS